MRHFSPLIVITASLPFLLIVPETVDVFSSLSVKETLMDISVSVSLKVPFNVPSKA